MDKTERLMCRSALMVICMMLFQVLEVCAAQKCDINIGVSLHPYYSWVKNIVGDDAQVSTLIPPGSDPHTYQPMPADLKNLQNLDILIINGLGHDTFVAPMLKAADMDNMKVIDTSKGLPLIPAWTKNHDFGNNDKVAYNSHTYLAVTTAIMQIQTIVDELGKLCPEQADLFKDNSRAYARKLRKLLAETIRKIEKIDMGKLRIATVHDGYAYLFQELGVEVTAVVQPRHGVEPSARQLQDTIKRIKKANVNVLFSELDYEKKYVDIIFNETGCRIYSLSHVSTGEYRKELFEEEISKNFDTIARSLLEGAEAK